MFAKNLILASLLIPSAFASDARKSPPEAITYRTTKGALFKLVEGPSTPDGGFGIAWQDPDGRIWSSVLPGPLEATNEALSPDQNGVVVDSPATRACARIGGSLPKKEDYEALSSYFDTSRADGGSTEIKAVFPDMINSWYWTASTGAARTAEDDRAINPHLAAFGEAIGAYDSPDLNNGVVASVHDGMYGFFGYGASRGMKYYVRCVAYPAK